LAAISGAKAANLLAGKRFENRRSLEKNANRAAGSATPVPSWHRRDRQRSKTSSPATIAPPAPPRWRDNRCGLAEQVTMSVRLSRLQLPIHAVATESAGRRWIPHFNLISWFRFAMHRLIVFTIGHSTRSFEAFVRLLRAHRIQRVVDVRRIPKSRHNPQFSRARLSPALHRARIHYRHLPGLGGLRHARRDSPNTGWTNASFRGYADYMQTPEFEESLERCINLAKRERTVLMCAEAVPWRCHRSLIADALLAKGVRVKEITSRLRARDHVLPPWARVKGTHVVYQARSEIRHHGAPQARLRTPDDGEWLRRRHRCC